METFLIILAIILALVGIAGSVVPGLPGPPLSWAAVLVLSFTSVADFSSTFLFITAGIAAVITVLDYVVPSLSTKKFGGSKAGIWGCNIGLVISIVGLPFGPQGLLGVILWPFIGAFVGELISGKASQEALRAAWGAFVGFLTGTGLKFVYSLILAIILIRDIIV
ncbi:MAG: DUF456 domain-containing protein [Bacteroidales bacterium]|nr:DUF456 domain-containing protein [Bacteroidales bacterium]